MLNKCLYLRQRSKKGIIYQVCMKSGKKRQINANECYICPFKEYKKYKMKQISVKRSKLEQKRYSILTNNLDICYICKKNKKDDIHEIYAGSKRQISIKNGFCIPVCRKCHCEIQNDESKMIIYKKECQMEFEKTQSREEWLKLVGRNYL